MNHQEREIHKARVIKELVVIDTTSTRRAIQFCATPDGQMALDDAVEGASAYEDMADLMIELSSMTGDERILHAAEERNVEMRKTALKLRGNMKSIEMDEIRREQESVHPQDVVHGRCVTDEELVDELENLTQDEAAELAETIEAERKKAIREFIQRKET